MNSHHEERGLETDRQEPNPQKPRLGLSEFQFSLSHYILRPNFNAVSGNVEQTPFVDTKSHHVLIMPSSWTDS